MELRHLRYFVAVAQELHYGRAAERLYIAQPPLSQQIIQLEKEVGVPLLVRNSRRVQLTPAGQAFLEDATDILARVEQAALRARRASRGEAGWLGVGFVASATHELLPAILRAFRGQFPDVELALHELSTAGQTLALHEQKIHVAFARPPIEDQAFVVEILAQETLVVALPQDHPLVVQSEVPLTMLAGESFITYPRQPKPSFTDYVIQVCEEAGFVPRITQEALQMQTALSLVAAGLGVSLLPASVQAVQRRGVVYRPAPTATAAPPLTVAYRRQDSSPVLARFLDVMRAVIAAAEARRGSGVG